MKYILVLTSVVMIIFNIIKNKKTVLTIVVTLLGIFLTYFLNITRLIYSNSERIVGINNTVFFILSIIIVLLSIFMKIKYKFKKRNISFLLIIMLCMVFYFFNLPFAGGLSLDGGSYFEWNFNAYITVLLFLIIQINLFVNYISQKNNLEK